ncbi:MAG: VOC family protein, partial [Rhodospirillaceae bacterium]|nr:VOC family protein [Rhodospirillaceae bacterium]
MTAARISIHGKRLQLAPFGVVADGRMIGGSMPTG